MSSPSLAGGSAILSDQSSEALPAELAPFLAAARERLEEATDGLQPDEVIRHLETTLAQTEAEANRLGLHIGALAGGGVQRVAVGDGDAPVVVIRQMVEPGEA